MFYYSTFLFSIIDSNNERDDVYYLKFEKDGQTIERYIITTSSPNSYRCITDFEDYEQMMKYINGALSQESVKYELEHQA